LALHCQCQAHVTSAGCHLIASDGGRLSKEITPVALPERFESDSKRQPGGRYARYAFLVPSPMSGPTPIKYELLRATGEVSRIHTGPVGTAKKLWEEAEIGDVSGEDVIEAIGRGNLWLLIPRVDTVSEPIAALLQSAYEEIDANVEGNYPTFGHISDILISSPAAQVYYHFDKNGQTLWQVHGSKRVYVYPNRPRYLTKEMLEYVALYADETSVPYAASYN
jgi:hypothetical protein